jgi:hypothetical protein
MSLLLALLIAPASGALTAATLRRAGLSRKAAGAAAGAVIVSVLFMLVVSWLVGFGECVAENRSPAPPPSWPWSPRRLYCDSASSPAYLGSLVVLLIPLVSIIGGAL